MNKRDQPASPFAGLRLSAAGGVDQRLFQSAPPAAQRPSVAPPVQPAPTTSTPPSTAQPTNQPTNQPIDQSTHQSASQPTEQSVSQSTSQTTDRGADRATAGLVSGHSVVARPKSFYITHRLDARLDAAVRFYQDQHGIPRVDRSTIVNAFLDRDELWSDRALDSLFEQVLGQLTSRLVGRARAPRGNSQGGADSYGPDTVEQP